MAELVCHQRHRYRHQRYKCYAQRHKPESQYDRREARTAKLQHRSSIWPPPALPREHEPGNNNNFQEIEVLADALPHSSQREKQDLNQLHISFIGPSDAKLKLEWGSRK